MDEWIGGVLDKDSWDEIEVLWALLYHHGVEEPLLDVATVSGNPVSGAVWRDFG